VTGDLFSILCSLLSVLYSLFSILCPLFIINYSLFIKNVILKLFRRRIGPKVTDGILKIDGYRFCDTAENSKHRIPAGCYKVYIKDNEHEHLRVPTLYPEDKCMRIRHKCYPIFTHGNGVFRRRRHEIVLGQHLVPGVVLHSYATYFTLYHRIVDCLKRGETVEVWVVN